MENPKIALKHIISDDVTSIDKIYVQNVEEQEILKHMKIQEELV